MCTSSASSLNSSIRYVICYGYGSCINTNYTVLPYKLNNIWFLIILVVLLCCEEEIQPRLISTRCSSWYLTNECLAGSTVGTGRSCNILWPLQYLCTFFHVFLLHDGCIGTRISKVYLVEATHDKPANDSICGNLCSWHSTLVSNRLQISISIWVFHRSSRSLVFCTFCAILHPGISLWRTVQKTTIKGKYSILNLICKLAF